MIELFECILIYIFFYIYISNQIGEIILPILSVSMNSLMFAYFVFCEIFLFFQLEDNLYTLKNTKREITVEDGINYVKNSNETQRNMEYRNELRKKRITNNTNLEYLEIINKKEKIVYELDVDIKTNDIYHYSSEEKNSNKDFIENEEDD